MSRDAPRRYLVAYDIVDDRRRSHVARALAGFGDRVQFSVFVVDARPARVVRLRSKLQRIIDQEADSILVCDLGPLSGDPESRMDVLGRWRPVTSDRMLIV
jgi:CRISPR-associated protein Cas2